VRNDGRFDFLFFAVPDPSINAFAMPGGYIGVNTGLILLTQNESELASVLAHEITHVTQNHMARFLENQKSSLLMSLAALAVALIAARSNSSSAGRHGRGRDHVRAGADGPEPAQLHARERVRGRPHRLRAARRGRLRPGARGVADGAAAEGDAVLDGSVPTYLRTHPVTYERIAEAQSRAQNKPVPAGRPTRSTSRWCARCCAATRAARRGGRVVRGRARRRASTTARSRRATGSSRRCCATARSARAKQELATLERIAPPHPMIEAMAGHVLLDGGEPDKAAARFEAALARYPTKMQLVYDYPEALIAAGKPAQAAAFSEAQLSRFPSDGPLHRIAAKAYAAQGKDAEAAPAPRRVLRLAGQPQAGDRPARARDQGRRRELLRELGRRDAPARAQARAGRAAQGRLRTQRRLEPVASGPISRTRTNNDPTMPAPSSRQSRARLAQAALSCRPRSSRSPPQGYGAWTWYAKSNGAPAYRLAKVERGAIQAVVSASGTLQAVTTVQVGSQVSGQIKEILVDFNTPVKKGQLPRAHRPRELRAQGAPGGGRPRGRAHRAACSARATRRAALAGHPRADHRAGREDRPRAQAVARAEGLHLARRARQGEVRRAGRRGGVRTTEAQVKAAEAQVANAAATVKQREAALASRRTTSRRPRSPRRSTAS
jgi:predicted Zn-dependent protease